MIFGDSITPAEKEPLTEMLFKREASLAWDFLEIERVKTEVTLRRRLEPLKKPHGKFLAFALLVSEKIIDMLRERLHQGGY